MDEEIIINDDEMIGYIMRTLSNEGTDINYDVVESVLDAQQSFYESKGLIEEAYELHTKVGVITDNETSKEPFQFQDSVRAVSLTVGGELVDLDDGFWCAVRASGELVLVGEASRYLRGVARQGILSKTKHPYSAILNNGKFMTGYLFFTSFELSRDVGVEDLVEIIAETIE